jgi:hypothetical protein
MRDLAAGIVALALLIVAGSLATTLRFYRRRRQRVRDSERALGRAIIAELPAADDLVLFSEDTARFYYGETSIDKDLIAAVRLLINGATIAAAVRAQHGPGQPGRAAPNENPDIVDDRPEGIARDRWDVALETVNGTVLVQCGAIRERVSQELARAVFDAVKREIDRRNEVTTPSQARRRDD